MTDRVLDVKGSDIWVKASTPPALFAPLETSTSVANEFDLTGWAGLPPAITNGFTSGDMQMEGVNWNPRLTTNVVRGTESIEAIATINSSLDVEFSYTLQDFRFATLAQCYGFQSTTVVAESGTLGNADYVPAQEIFEPPTEETEYRSMFIALDYDSNGKPYDVIYLPRVAIITIPAFTKRVGVVTSYPVGFRAHKVSDATTGGKRSFRRIRLTGAA